MTHSNCSESVGVFEKKTVSLWFLQRTFWQYWNSRTSSQKPWIWYQLQKRTPIFYCILLFYVKFHVQSTIHSFFAIPGFANSAKNREHQNSLKCTYVTYHFTVFFLHKSCSNIRFRIKTIFREFAKFAKFANRQSD
jgi:hypothetical protein